MYENKKTWHRWCRKRFLGEKNLCYDVGTISILKMPFVYHVKIYFNSIYPNEDVYIFLILAGPGK